MAHTHRDTWWGGLAHKSTGMFGYWMLEIVNCIRGGFNGTNPRGSTPQSAETAEICGTNLWQFLIVLTNLQSIRKKQVLNLFPISNNVLLSIGITNIYSYEINVLLV